MRHPIRTVISQMISYEQGEPQRVHHFLKVHAFAHVIGESECLSEREQEILEVAAVLHDVGIRESLRKYGSSAGRYQELEGPPIARDMLSELGYDAELIDRVCYLIAHHHTYDAIEGKDYQILVEADFLVNALEQRLSTQAVSDVLEKLFRTEKGIAYLKTMYFAREG